MFKYLKPLTTVAPEPAKGFPHLKPLTPLAIPKEVASVLDAYDNGHFADKVSPQQSINIYKNIKRLKNKYEKKMWDMETLFRKPSKIKGDLTRNQNQKSKLEKQIVFYEQELSKPLPLYKKSKLEKKIKDGNNQIIAANAIINGYNTSIKPYLEYSIQHLKTAYRDWLTLPKKLGQAEAAYYNQHKKLFDNLELDARLTEELRSEKMQQMLNRDQSLPRTYRLPDTGMTETQIYPNYRGPYRGSES
jgi:hypothetical protein